MRIHEPVTAEQMPVLANKLPCYAEKQESAKSAPKQLMGITKTGGEDPKAAFMPCFSRKFAVNSLLSAIYRLKTGSLKTGRTATQPCLSGLFSRSAI